MIYLDNTTEYRQKIWIPREVTNDDATGRTWDLQYKKYVINENGRQEILPDPGYEGISSGTINVYVSAATGVTFEELEVAENGVYVPTGDSAYSAVTVNVPVVTQDKDYTLTSADSRRTEPIVITPDEGYDGIGKLSLSTDFQCSESQYMGELTQKGIVNLNGGPGSSWYFKNMVVKVNVQDTEAFEEGYASGYTDGYATGYTSGQTDGYGEGYTSGQTDGAAYQKSLLTSTTITSDGTYTRENGYNSITVDVISNSIVTLTQAQYDQLDPPDPNKIYLIKD